MKFENTEVFNLDGALRGMRNPMDAWKLNDSGWRTCEGITKYVVGPNDMTRALKLIVGGTEHRKFLRQIFVSVDITAPRFWWQEFDTYKIGTVANSCSTMHKLKAYPIEPWMFEIDSETYNEEHWARTLMYLETLRQEYVATNDVKYLRALKQALPEGFLQKRTITMNYENIITMLRQRKTHRLEEWSVSFVNWAMELPYMSDFYEASIW